MLLKPYVVKIEDAKTGSYSDISFYNDIIVDGKTIPIKHINTFLNDLGEFFMDEYYMLDRSDIYFYIDAYGQIFMYEADVKILEELLK